jgi:hypothetical protein
MICIAQTNCRIFRVVSIKTNYRIYWVVSLKQIVGFIGWYYFLSCNAQTNLGFIGLLCSNQFYDLLSGFA